MNKLNQGNCYKNIISIYYIDDSNKFFQSFLSIIRIFD